MIKIGTCMGRKVVYSEKANAVYVCGTAIAIYGVKSKDEAVEKATKSFYNFIKK